MKRISQLVVAGLSVLLIACGGGGGSSVTYSISGSVNGLDSGNQVVLQNNSGNLLNINSNGNFTFPDNIYSNGNYAVIVATQPAGQTCTVNNSSGAGVVANITNINVACSDVSFPISGSVTGLTAGKQLVLLNNSSDATTIAANGNFNFSVPTTHSSSYAVTISAQPDGQTCTVNNSSGSGVVAPVSNINILCSTNTYTISGAVSGLTAGQQVTLTNNAGNATTLTSNGSFTFSTPVTYNGSYAVTVGTQPTGQTCSVSNGSGAGVVADISNVSVTCSTNTYTISGAVSGLTAGQQVTLMNNAGNATTLTSNGSFAFSTPVTHNGSYAVTVVTDRHIGATLRSAYRSQSMIAVMEPVRDRHIGASARSP